MDEAARAIDVASYVDATAALIGLPITPQHRSGVIESFRQLAEAAALVMAFPLADDIDPAPEFTP